MNWYSQAGQDKWVYENVKATGGYYVDLGAYDGLEHSNTAALDFDHGWHGVCVEANVDYYNSLVRNRPRPQNYNVAVADFAGQVNFSGQWVTADKLAPVVDTMRLRSILINCGAPKIIDYLSIDIEGMEYSVLSDFDFTEYRINSMTVEHNLYCDGPANKDKLFELLTSRGFVRVVEDAPCLDPVYFGKPYEDWYVGGEFYKEHGPFS